MYEEVQLATFPAVVEQLPNPAYVRTNYTNTVAMDVPEIPLPVIPEAFMAVNPNVEETAEETPNEVESDMYS